MTFQKELFLKLKGKNYFKLYMYFYHCFCVHKIFYVIIRMVVVSVKVHIMMPNKFPCINVGNDCAQTAVSLSCRTPFYSYCLLDVT